MWSPISGSTECEIAQVLVNYGARADISDVSGSTALQNAFENFDTYDVAKIVFPATLVDMSRWAETARYVLEWPKIHILYNERGASLITTSELEASDISEFNSIRFLLLPTKQLDFNKTSLLILNEHHRLTTGKRGLSYLIACRFITTYPRLELDRASPELVRRSHVLLWIMVKSDEGHDGLGGAKYILLKTASLITTSPHVELAINVCKLLNPFLRTLREEWMRVFETANHHQFEMRSTILKSRGNVPQVIDRLLEDALSWVQVEEIANEQRSDLSELKGLSDIEDFQRFGAAVSEFCEYLAAGVKNLRDTSQELIGLEFNLTSIREAQKSTSTSVSMKRLSWITFIFLPLTFVSSLFGMNVNVLESNPPWWIYLPFAFSTLGLTMVVWLTFKRYPSIEDKAERMFRKVAG
ncbi:hypothetical protein NCS52_00966700 [Fusarium sp. LHS14.1]|nr:hypothetical protein NCS52_00966700 [Fusarium sp. LHS14.1]